MNDLTNIHTPPCVALLSATLLTNSLRTGSEGEAIALLPFAGGSVLQYQLEALHELHINHIFIAIENMSGALIAFSEQMKSKNIAIDFVRRGRDLAEKLPQSAKCLIVADGIIASPTLLAKIVQSEKPIMVTLDSRDENQDFEKIDLNNRWAGLGLIDTQTAATITDLPEDWDILSSLMRQAVQNNISYLALPQSSIEMGVVAKITSEENAIHIARNLLKSRGADADGIVEAKVFNPLSMAIIPKIWPMKSANKIVALTQILCAFSTLILAYFVHPFLASISGIASLFLANIGDLMRVAPSAPFYRATKRIVGAVLIFAACVAVGFEGGIILAPLPLIAAGLWALSKQIPTVANFAQWLRSAGLLFVIGSIASGFGLIASTAMAVVIGQVAALLISTRAK